MIRAAGLIPLGVVPLQRMSLDMVHFRTWLDEKRHAGMAFLGQNLHLREDPRKLLPGIQTAIMFGLPYAQGDRLPKPNEAPRTAQYARLLDYHKLIWRQGQKLLEGIHARFGDEHSIGRVVTDSAPLLERALASQGGRGFIGKNTCFISPQDGSLMLLGELLTSLQLPASNPEGKKVSANARTKEGGCGTCRRCQVHCPTGALDQDYRIDARKCLAYWTIEHRGTIPEEFWPWLGRYVFGCDICQIVCPYNRTSTQRAAEDIIKLKETPPLFEMATMDQATYERLFAGTPMTRAKRTGLMRNALIAMVVTSHPQLQEAMKIASERQEGDVINATLAQIQTWSSRQTGNQPL